MDRMEHDVYRMEHDVDRREHDVYRMEQWSGVVHVDHNVDFVSDWTTSWSKSID